MERRSNPLPEVIGFEPDAHHGDFLDGLIANHEIIRARENKSPSWEAQTYKDPEVVIYSASDNALETIGADNFRGFNLKPDNKDGADNFRAKVEAK